MHASILLAALTLSLAACYRTRVIERPVVVHAPACLTRPAPLPPEGATPCDEAWSVYYVELSAWVAEAEACLRPDP